MVNLKLERSPFEHQKKISNHCPYHPWDWSVYLHLVDVPYMDAMGWITPAKFFKNLEVEPQGGPPTSYKWSYNPYK